MRSISSTLLLLGLCIGIAPALRATTTFQSFEGSGGQGTIGNSKVFGLITATAWSVGQTAGNTFATAALGQYSAGVGVCNSTESSDASGCTSTNPVEHAVDNVGSYDFVLLQFSQPVTSISLVLNPFGTSNQEMDATYFVGSCAPNATSCNPSGKTLTNLSGISSFNGKFSTTTLPDGTLNSGGSALTKTLTINFGAAGSSVNWLLVGTATGQTDDMFKIDSVTYGSVPEPATFGLAGAALAAMAFLRRKKKLSATI